MLEARVEVEFVCFCLHVIRAIDLILDLGFIDLLETKRFSSEGFDPQNNKKSESNSGPCKII